MKKMILSAAALFVFGLASAQDKEAKGTGTKGFANGDLFVSGSLGYSSESTDDVKTSSFNISPKVGLFVTDNIAIGARIGFVSTKDEDGIADDVKTNTFEIGAFGRYYMTPASDFSFFAELGANYTTSKEDDGIGDDEKVNGFNIGLSPGISYFVSNNWALEASVGLLRYGTEKPDEDNAESTDSFDLGVNLTNVNIGVIYKF